MLLQQLVRYANEAMEQPAPGYQRKPIRYVIELDSKGRLRNLHDYGANGKKDIPLREVPHLKRASIVPILIADTVEYALGIPNAKPAETEKLDKVELRWNLYLDLLEDCASATGVTEVRTVATYVNALRNGEQAKPEGLDPAANVTFLVDTIWPTDDIAVKAWWANRLAPSDSGSKKLRRGRCFICGTEGPILRIQPLKIKGIPGGQPSGTDLISANTTAFESYGLSGSEIAPTCATCGEAHGNALNHLLSSKQTSFRTTNLAFAYWAQPGANESLELDPYFSTDVSTDQVSQLLKAPFAANRAATAIAPPRFYAVVLAANAARVVVKDWIDTTVAEAKQSLVAYFQSQELVEWDGSPWKPLPLFQLARSTIRTNVRNSENPPDIVIQSLLRNALLGNSLPDDLLYLAVRRNRLEQRVSTGRATLIKMVLNQSEQEPFMPGLDPDRQEEAYLLGRLLALYGAIQWRALGDVNTNVIDKYYASASGTPGLVFPILDRGAKQHLAKIRRDRPGAYVNVTRQVEQLWVALTSIPDVLTLKQQGVFALGFYHQRAFDRSAAAARGAKTTDPEMVDVLDEPAPTE